MANFRKQTFTCILFSLFTIISGSLFIHQIKAQEPQLSQRWICLKAEHCWRRRENTCAVQGGHRAKIYNEEGTYALANKETYLVECIMLDSGPVCTTGNADLDQELNFYTCDPEDPQSCTTNYSFLNREKNYRFENVYQSDGVTPLINPPMSDAQGNVGPYEWVSHSRGADRYFLALNYFDTLTSTGQFGQKQATFTFEEAAQNCVVVRWDPYGRVFDSQSLEPMANVRVSLFKKRDDDSFTFLSIGEVGAGFFNPYLTKEDGGFSFVVPDGVYKIAPAIPSHTFPSNQQSINPNYGLAYSDLYQGEEIVQQGGIEHRDIPMDPLGEPYHAPVALIDYMHTLDKINNILTLEGRVSHPLTKIELYSQKPDPQEPNNLIRSQLLAVTTADKNGAFSFKINQNRLKPEEVIGEINLIKVDLTQNPAQTKTNRNQKSLLAKIVASIKKLLRSKVKVRAEQKRSTKISIQPIPNYLEGYAYDPKGNIIPNATVGVYLNFSTAPYYQTKADDQGYFRISSNNLPFMAYHLKFTSPKGKRYSLTPAKFILQNRQYIRESNINLNTYTPSSSTTVSSTPPIRKNPTLTAKKEPAAANKSTRRKTATDKKIPSSPSPQPASVASKITLILVILIGLITLAGGLLFFYIKKRQESV